MGPHSGCQRNALLLNGGCWGIYGRVVLYKAREELAEVVGINGSKSFAISFTEVLSGFTAGSK